MRKLLLASAAALGASMGMAGIASAQAPALPAGPLSGSFVTAPYGGPGANNNNNYQAAMLPGAIANPTPGSFVVRLNAANWFYVGIEGSSADRVSPSNNNGTPGNYKVAPYNALEYFRLYPGVDAMATNGLRYGGMTEIRENWSSQSYNSGSPSAGSSLSSTASTGSSGFTSTQTLYVRRAFVYLASDKVGILRLGEADGVPGSFDNGVTTFQNYDTGQWNGDAPTMVPSNINPAWPFFSQTGNEYGSNKIVYFSPQFAGFDFGLEWSPNNTNGEDQCGAAGISCTNLSSQSASTSAGARYMNLYSVGARYQGTFGPVAIYGMADYLGSGHTSYTGAAPLATWNGKFDNLSAADVGLVFTIAGVTFGGHYIGGAINGTGALRPQGGAPGNAWIAGVQYATGPFVMGVSYYNYQSQGEVTLTKISQRYDDGLDVGGTWNAAPGLYFFVNYLWGQRHQGGYNFIAGADNSAGTNPVSNQGNTVQSQALIIGTKVRW